ncbi:MAG TPA: prepilin-type N-terminal cleavage/methylation domain-containing protein [Armatimonadota bacterium]|nr:prepilin-type N-terminal cleavage/methylation domain-containing protein [Armatimonadota bacterium]
MFRHRRVRRGLTLIELLVSCFILAVGLVGLSQLYITAMWSYQKARYMSLATQRAQYELERVENFKFNVMQNSANLINDSVYPAAAGYSTLSAGNGVQFSMNDLPNGRGTITVSHFNNQANLLRVDIQISWKEPRQTVSPIRISTLLVK